MACHVRSISFPAKSHSLVLKVEEELNKLRGCVASSSTLTYQMILDALQGVRNLYQCINDLLCMSNNQNKGWVERELEDSIKLLDICNTSRDSLGEIKNCIQDLELALRRCKSEGVKSEARDYKYLVKKASKDVSKQASRRNERMEGDPSVSGLLREARDITISVFQSLFSFLSKDIVGQKTSKWSVVSITFQKLKLAHKEEQENAFDIDSLRIRVERLENELECLFRCTIQYRVSLLNICSM